MHVLTFLTSLFIIFLILIKLSIFLTNSTFYFSRHNFSSSSSTKLILTIYPEGIPLSSDTAISLSHMPCYHCWLTTRTTCLSCGPHICPYAQNSQIFVTELSFTCMFTFCIIVQTSLFNYQISNTLVTHRPCRRTT